ncbi:hypothetical protein [Motiliproteus sp.]|uniref:hypothetical protein n=1 Tax=Motiliproteus sp. TaxID=1898955 RepID=UPI003BAAD5B3
MTYIVNAWLERERPQLQVTDRRTGKVVMEWGAERLKSMFATGELCLADLQASDAQLQETIKELFLLSYRPS